MKALVISEYAHPSKIPLTRDAPVPVPTPGSDELLINVHSAGLNFFDVCLTLSALLYFPRLTCLRIFIRKNRYCRPKESIRRNRRALLCLAPSLPAPSRSRRSGAPSSPVTGCLDIPKARMESKSLPSQFTYCRCRMPSRLTKAQVSLVFAPPLAHWAAPKRVLRRALRDLSDELRGTRGAWEITGW